jgi:hypothetical protein
MGTDLDTIKIVLNLTINEIQSADDNFKKLISNPKPNLSAINALGHKLFGTASGTGLEVLAEMAREVELITEMDIKTLKTIYKKVNKEILISKELIENELVNL